MLVRSAGPLVSAIAQERRKTQIARFTLAGVKKAYKLRVRVRLDYSGGSDLKGLATAANAWCSARPALPLTGHGHSAVVHLYNYSSSSKLERLVK